LLSLILNGHCNSAVATGSIARAMPAFVQRDDATKSLSLAMLWIAASRDARISRTYMRDQSHGGTPLHRAGAAIVAAARRGCLWIAVVVSLSGMLPSGRPLEGRGIAPDITVASPGDAAKPLQDPQLLAAVNYLRRGR
jgi:hypothetical protein